MARLGFAVLAASLLGSCVEAPFAHVNPNDPAVEFTMSIVASADTATSETRVVQFRLITDPQITGHEPAWSASPALLAVHLGGGAFSFVPGPSTTVLITAAFLGRTATYNITRMP
jgi:hypothetical protein